MTDYTFGNLLRASRLGFHWCKPLGCFVRMSGSGPFAVELCSPDALPSGPGAGKRKGDEHRCWWEGDKDGERLIDMAPALARRVGQRVDGRVALTLDDDGEVVA